jgi:uncharacterized membrane protein YedE/YeeE
MCETQMKPLLLFAAFGLAYGFVLQRSGFCFAKAGFELFLLRGREAVNGVLAGLIVGTVGFGIVAWARAQAGANPGAHLLIIPVGPGTVVGGLLFGLGMTLAGMCVAGTLLRLGEGYLLAWATLGGIVIGAALDPMRTPIGRLLGHRSSALWLGQWIGAPLGSLLTVACLIAMWVLLARRGGSAIRPASRPLAAPSANTLGDRRGSPLQHLPPAVMGGALLGLLNTVQMAVRTPWTVSYPLALLSSGASSQTVRYAVPLVVLDAGIVLGALISAAVGEGVRLRAPQRKKDLAIALAGGLLMGWGIRLAGTCNIGGIFSALPSLSVSAWLFLPAVLAGAWVGTKVVCRLN